MPLAHPLEKVSARASISRPLGGCSTSTSTAPVIATSSSYVVEKTAAGCPAAAHTTGCRRSHGSIQVRTGAGWSRGETPPMTCPVWRRTNSGSARLSRPTPMRSATAAVSTRWAPEVRIRTGSPSASKSRLLAMAPTSHPSAAAASAAVWALSGRMTTSPVPPRRVCSPRNEVMDACSIDMMRA